MKGDRHSSASPESDRKELNRTEQTSATDARNQLRETSFDNIDLDRVLFLPCDFHGGPRRFPIEVHDAAASNVLKRDGEILDRCREL